MAPKRKILGETDGNVRKRPNLTPNERGQIQGKRAEGASITRLATEHECHRTTVFRTLTKSAERHHGKDLPRSGRPAVCTERARRAIHYYVCRNIHATYDEIRRDCRVSACNNTIYKVLQDYGIANWRQKKRVELDAEKARVRLEWCKKH